MGDVIETGDQVRLSDGTVGRVISIEHFVGLYVLDIDGKPFAVARHEFKPLKWEGDTLGNTGIGVCAKNGSEEIAA